MLRFIWEQPGRLTRREWLRIGGLGLFGAASGKAGLLARESGAAPPGFGRAKSVVLVFASGGQSQLEMWDPKPAAPADVRGAFAPQATSVPGVHFTEHMPRIAQIADRLTVVRSMSHEDLDHGSAVYLALTGRYHTRRSSNPPPRPTDYPTYGSVLRRARPSHRFVYDAVHVNAPAMIPRSPSPGQNGGLLGAEYDPMVLGDVSQEEIVLPGMESRDELPPVRLEARKSLKTALDQYTRELSSRQQASDMSHLYEQAYRVLTSPRCRQAFDLGEEPESLRDRYGRHRSGQACLMARRLVEAGVPWITVMWNHSNRGQDVAPNDPNLYGWDTHNDIFVALKDHLLPRFDQSFSTFIEDMDQRGLLEDTLVICMGEFGRAPKVAHEANFAGSSPGRKHWASVYSIVAAGAGVQRAAVVGASDRFAAEPASERFGPWDVAATMFSALGIPHDGHYYDQLNRPFPITVGRPITQLYGG